MHMSSYEMRDIIIDAMAETLVDNEKVPADTRNKIRAYLDVQKAEKKAADVFDEESDDCDCSPE